MTSLEITNLSVKLGNKEVLHNLDLTIPSGSFAALLGPSGCGKTTLLRTVAGLVRPSAGAIRFGKKLVSVSSLVLPPNKRNIGYLPQEGGLFPHLNVADNVGFAISKNVERKERDDLVEEMLALVGLSGMQRRKPHQLSGGQQTRVALARALATRPAIVLLDEPFSNLDHALRVEVSAEVVDLLKRSKTTSLTVTHDREDALVSADLIALMGDGNIVQSGTPKRVYMEPKSAEIAESTGDILEIPAKRFGNQMLRSPLHLGSKVTNANVEDGALLIRPEEIEILDSNAALNSEMPSAKIEHIQYYGHDAILELSLPEFNKKLRVRVTEPLKFDVGEVVRLKHTGPIRWISGAPGG